MIGLSNEDLAVEVRLIADGMIEQRDRDLLVAIVQRLESSIPAAVHDARVSELLEANTLLILRSRRPDKSRRNDRPFPEWRPTHLHYRGAGYRLLGSLRREGDGALLLRYVSERGVEWARPVREFLETVRDDEIVRRRFAPMIGEVREVKADLVPLDCYSERFRTVDRWRITLHEYMILAKARLIQEGAPRDFVERYGHDQWAEAWRNGVSPLEAAADEIIEARAAA